MRISIIVAVCLHTSAALTMLRANIRPVPQRSYARMQEVPSNSEPKPVAANPVATQSEPGLVTQLAAVSAERDELRVECKALREERDQLAAQCSTLQTAADARDSETLRLAARARLARRTLLQNIATINLLVIVTFGLGIAYSLLETDIRAVFALYYFDLGPDVYPGFARWVVALDLFLRLPGELLHQYELLVPTNPVFYKACTSGVAYTFGDFISQIYQGRDLSTLDLPRSFRSGTAGFIGHGPLCHFWMLAMERYLDFGGAWWATGFKVLADQTVWSLYLNACYSFLIGSLAFRNPGDVWKDVKATSWPALRSSWRFWPFVHCISFSHAVPLDLKLLWVDVMEVVWVTILSRVANQDGAEEEEVVIAESFGVDPTLEIELSRQMMAGQLMYAGSEGWQCSDEGDCYLYMYEAELAEEKDEGFFSKYQEQLTTFSLPTLPPPKQLLDNCWPLLAMWPVLYAFYQGELALGLEV